MLIFLFLLLIFDVDTHDAPCRLLAERSGVPVLAVTYRLAPEHPFPAAHDDAYAAFREVHERAAELDGAYDGGVFKGVFSRDQR